MYSSTATGSITKSGLGKSLFMNWRIWLVVFILLFCAGLLIYTLDDYKGLGSENNNVDTTEQIKKDSSFSENTKTFNDVIPSAEADNKDGSLSVEKVGGVSGGFSFSESIAQATIFLNSKLNGLTFDFNDAFISSSQKIINKGNKYYHYLINYKGQYFDSYELALMGFDFTYVSDCMTFVSHSGTGRILSCDRNVKPWTGSIDSENTIIDDVDSSNTVIDSDVDVNPLLKIVS